MFDEEIRQHLYGKRGSIYRILFTVQENNVNILYIRHSAQQWVTPPYPSEDKDE